MSVRIQEDATGYLFSFTCQDGDGDAINLTSSTVTFRLKPPGDDAVDNVCTISDATAGLATFTTTSTDIDTAGRWQGQLKLHTASQDIWSVPFDIIVGANL